MFSVLVGYWIFFSVIFYFVIPRQCDCPVKESKDNDDSSLHYWDDMKLW